MSRPAARRGGADEAPVVSFSHRAFDDLTLRELHDLLRLRDEVFVVGQKITAEPEIDGRDPECVHVLGLDAGGHTVATARIFLTADPVTVGRVAVATALQRRGIGTQLMEYVQALLRSRRASLSAQAHLRPWYERLGWRVEGGVYDEAGIPHVRMTREAARLTTRTPPERGRRGRGRSGRGPRGPRR